MSPLKFVCPKFAKAALVALFVAVILSGCGQQQSNQSPQPAPLTQSNRAQSIASKTVEPEQVNFVEIGTDVPAIDLAKVKLNGISVLFVGNSQTTKHNLPCLTCKMMQFRHPNKTIYYSVIPVNFLEDLTKDVRCKKELETGFWQNIVFQGQKVSMSGNYEYPRKDAIEVARFARQKGVKVFFFSEWGRKGFTREAEGTEKIYGLMATASRRFR